jgi:hypothetical protein
MDSMPDIATIFRWTQKYPEFCAKYREARNFREDIEAEDLRDLADEPLIGERITVSDKDGRKVVTGDNVERAKLKVHTRMWIASKLLPKKYAAKGDDDPGRKDRLNELEDVFRAGPVKTEEK